MNENPWKQKESMDVAHMLAERNGFKLVQDYKYHRMVCLQTKGNNEHGFVNDITLNVFSDWENVVSFFAGWEKAQLAKALGVIKKPRSKK